MAAMVTAAAVMLANALPVAARNDSLAGLDAYVTQHMRQWGVPGLALAVVKDGQIVLARGYGTRTLGKRQPVDENTLFAIGSQTKYFTANALAILVAEGKIGWDDLMTDRLPGFRVMDDLVTKQTTLVDALAHRTGSERGDGAWWSRPSLSRAGVLELMRYLRPEKPFRSSYIYNNLMFAAAGEVIPAVTGTSWDDFVKSRLLQPSGMKRSNTSIRELAGNDNVATPHERSSAGVVPVPYHDIDNVAPAGSINSSALEMAQWLRLQLNDGKAGDRVVVPESALRETRLIRNPMDGASGESLRAAGMSRNFAGYGLGIQVSDVSGRRAYSHGGGIDGMNSFSAFIPEMGLGVTVLVNRGSQFAMPLTAWILDRYSKAQERDWIDEFLGEQERIQAAADRKKSELLQEADGASAKTMRLSEYVGLYDNDFMGSFAVVMQAGKLVYTSGETLTGSLTPLRPDTFYASVSAPITIDRWGRASGPAQFTRDANGVVDGFVLRDRRYERRTSKTPVTEAGAAHL